METQARKKREPIAATMLARFLTANKLKPVEVAREAGVSRQHLCRIRKGIADPGYMLAMRIRDACGRLLLRFVSIDELFDSSDPQALRMRAEVAKEK
ncbi:MAG TPA: helix-turn-helix transcriptional regulator [Thermoanaerobaculia bacterium]|nr:helix-turn-helix transcriptional regulator [Thermoanaerobaculia bacterium]